MNPKMKSKINFGHKTVNFSIIRSARRKKTIALSIEPAGYVLVRAPINTPYPRLTQIVKSKAEWIIRRLSSLENAPPLVKKEFVSGESFPLLGRHLRLKVLQDSDVKKLVVRTHRKRIEVVLNNASTNGASPTEIKNAITKWYKIKAAELIPERTKVYAKKMGVQEPKVFIRDQQKRWGSCNSKGVLRFNWRVIMAPMSLIDYVVVHELCHLKYMNHSKLFWKYLGMIMPDYEKRERSLKENGIVFQI